MLDKLIKLLSKISNTSKPVGIDVNYDGSKFTWKIKMSNITAEEYQVGENGDKY